jgi:hypothetical protein
MFFMGLLPWVKRGRWMESRPRGHAVVDEPAAIWMQRFVAHASFLSKVGAGGTAMRSWSMTVFMPRPMDGGYHSTTLGTAANLLPGTNDDFES